MSSSTRPLDTTDRSLASVITWCLVCAFVPITAWRLFQSLVVQHPGLAAPLRIDFAIVCVLAVLLAVLGAWIHRTGRFAPASAFAGGALFGAMTFIAILGTPLLDPTSVNWLLRDDLAQHYSGWAMFRHAPWAWPPGLTTTLSHPVGTSIVYTDSLPLLAFPMKLLGPLLPVAFQYIGLWMAIGFTLQGGFGALLARGFSRDPAIVLACAALFVSAPMLLNRFGHDTLTAQWLLLAAIGLYARHDAIGTLVKIMAPWWLLAATAALVHPYLATMVLAMFVASLGRRVFVDRTITKTAATIALVTAIALVILLWWLSGAFIIGDKRSISGVPYGHYSFNLLGLFDSMGFSRYVPAFEVGPGQYEGFAWPGLGMWLVFATALVVGLVFHRRHHGGWRGHMPLLVVLASMTVFATSSVVMVGTTVLVDHPIEHPIIGAFRSSGRFIWPLYYTLFALSLFLVARHLKPVVAMATLVLACIVQLADASLIHAHFAGKRTLTITAPAGSRLVSPRWLDLVEGRRHLTVLPPRGCGPNESWLPFVLLASENRMTINSAYLARVDGRRISAYCDDLRTQLEGGHVSTDDLYVIVDEAWMDQFPATRERLVCETLDGYAACLAPADTGSPSG